MHDEHAHSAAPEQPGEAGDHGTAYRHPQAEGHRQARQRPEHERPVDEAHRGITEEVAGVASLGAPVGVDEQPADVRVHQPREAPRQPFPCPTWGL